ncbi:MAG: methionyl-tRNA formyltransferase [Desulfobacterota bacterium]|nr:methionyl-tRNA formyltransferase [Thermodesulfobacteriota bacterium]
MRILFMGTAQFAVPSLKILLSRSENIVGVFTQPDRPQGRGLKLKISPVKDLALSNQLLIFQPEKINQEESVKIIKQLKPELIVVVSFGQILSSRILSVPQFGAINLHASLLPKYRGAAPINWAILRGERETGVTTILMDKGMDTGDILLQKKVEILPHENAGELHDRLALIGAEVLSETIEKLKQGILTPQKQNESEASYAPVLKKENGIIDWEKPADDIYNHIRGMNPWPGAFTFLSGKIFKIHRAKRIGDSAATKFLPGKVLDASEEGIIVATAKGLIILTEVQLENHKRMSASLFLRGNPIPIGTRLGKE